MSDFVNSTYIRKQKTDALLREVEQMTRDSRFFEIKPNEKTRQAYLNLVLLRALRGKKDYDTMEEEEQYWFNKITNNKKLMPRTYPVVQRLRL